MPTTARVESESQPVSDPHAARKADGETHGGETHDDTADYGPFERAPATTATVPDYYAVLGVQRGATPDEVRRAYHRLALLWHPDRFMSAPPALRDRAERRTRALNAAYAVLGDPVKRATYDLRTPVTHLRYRAAHHAAYAARPNARAQRQGTTEIDDIYEDGRAVATPDSDGTGIFLGGLVAVIALVLFVAALQQHDSTTGRYITLGLAIILAGVAFWCVTQSNVLTRLANQVLAGAPPVPSEDRAPSDHTDRTDGTEQPDSATSTADDVYDRDDVVAEGDEDDQGDEDDEDDAAFERLVEEAVAGIPAEFQAAMHNVVVRVKRNPSAEDIARLSVRENGLLLGLYEGVDATRQGVAGAPLPEVITIFRRPIEHYCHHTPDRIRDQIRRTVLHELAHHFGIDHDAMPDWIR